jgi:hypothetical protein
MMTTGEDGFAAFFTQIEAPSLRDIVGHWNEVRAGRRMPAWQNIDPVAIAVHLPIVWSWRYHRDTEQFVGRLIGQTVADLFGKSIRGVKMEDYFQGKVYDAVYSRCHRVVTEPCFSRDHGNIFHYRDRLGTGERIMMPLADDGIHADGVFGATAFDLSAYSGIDQISYAAEILEYYPL